MIFRSGRALLAVLLFLILQSLWAQTTEYQKHTVQKGETLSGLSRKYGVSVDELKRLNNLKTSNLQIGQVLRIKPKPTQAPPPVRDPAPTPPPASPPVTEQMRVQLPEEYYYTVKSQDNLYRISVNNSVKLKDLIVWNGFADENHKIKPGDMIIIKDPSQYEPGAGTPPATQTPPSTPPANPPAAETEDFVERVHVVQPKETLYRIASDNGMTVEELKRLNNLTSNKIKVGQRLYLTPRREGSIDLPPSPGITEPDLEGSERIRTDLIMPVDGSVSSEFGIRNGRPHKGMDIAARTGTPIYAVLDGTVAFSGYQGAYGNVVVLEHPDFVMTVYAHNEKNLVNVGDQVAKGQPIASVGATGDASGAHVHFEYRIKGKAINPRKVLPFDK
ncbi:MAG: LysM peptidoglycan-binding domain-containing protein [Candidatus Cloacimonetes bacterium]|nr:LysM peptidoglycan-binding domain-containing protein [Candidatus Cloacimonadota bacterium]